MGLRVAVLSYRSKPHGGGQGVYVRQLSRGLAALGHDVTVFSGQPYPHLDSAEDLPGSIRLEEVPSLDLYREPDPFRTPHWREFRDGIDVREYLGMITAEFPEPLTFSLRAARELAGRVGEFDVVHDNQCLGDGLLDIAGRFPLVTTIHHPITRDLAADLAVARGWKRLSVRRWYAFLRMQKRVAAAQQHVITVSGASAASIAQDFGVSRARIHVVPLGVETDLFAPKAAHSLHLAGRVPGRIVTVATSDTAVKGVDTLLTALARLRDTRPGRPLELVMVCRPTEGGLASRLIERHGLRDLVTFVDGLPAAEIAALLASAEVACTPSRYEGFSLPTLEAMSCATPLVVTRAGAIPEVVGPPGTPCSPALIVPPGDPVALADALAGLLDDPEARARLGAAGRRRAVERFDWEAVALATTRVYEQAIATRTLGVPSRGNGSPPRR